MITLQNQDLEICLMTKRYLLSLLTVVGSLIILMHLLQSPPPKIKHRLKLHLLRFLIKFKRSQVYPKIQLVCESTPEKLRELYTDPKKHNQFRNRYAIESYMFLSALISCRCRRFVGQKPSFQVIWRVSRPSCNL